MMMDSRPVESVAPDRGPARARLTPTHAFSDALARGLIDTAFAFDGSLRAVGAMSLADRSAYGIPVRHASLGASVATAPCARILPKPEQIPYATHVVKGSVGCSSQAEVRSAATHPQPRSVRPHQHAHRVRVACRKTTHVPSRPFFQATLRAGATLIRVLVARGRTFLSVSAWTR